MSWWPHTFIKYRVLVNFNVPNSEVSGKQVNTRYTGEILQRRYCTVSESYPALCFGLPALPNPLIPQFGQCVSLGTKGRGEHVRVGSPGPELSRFVLETQRSVMSSSGNKRRYAVESRVSLGQNLWKPDHKK